MSAPSVIGQDVTGKNNIVQWTDPLGNTWFYSIPIALGPWDPTVNWNGGNSFLVNGYQFYRYTNEAQALAPGLFNPTLLGTKPVTPPQLTQGNRAAPIVPPEFVP